MQLNLPLVISRVEAAVTAELENAITTETPEVNAVQARELLWLAVRDYAQIEFDRDPNEAGDLEPEANAENGYVDDFEESGPFADAQAAQEYLDAEANAS